MDDSFSLIFNAHHEPLDFVLPSSKYGKEWTKILDTSAAECEQAQYEANDTLNVAGRSVVVLQHPLFYAKANDN
jgi:glycogen operon protein